MIFTCFTYKFLQLVDFLHIFSCQTSKLSTYCRKENLLIVKKALFSNSTSALADLTMTQGETLYVATLFRVVEMTGIEPATP